jgi:ABC-2 type transport system permease protein
MNAVKAIFKREFAAYFATPLAYVFIVIFLFAMGAFTFYVGRFYDNGIADLSVFFGYHPWLYLFLVPAIGMRLWADERRTGTIELLLTLPIPIWATVLGKFLAAWAFTAVALALTFPVWITVNFLGNPDNGVILASYVGSLLMAGGYLAISAAISASTSNQVIAFVVSVVICFCSPSPRVTGARFLPALGAGRAGNTVLVQLSHPFPSYLQRCDRPSRSHLLRIPDRAIPFGQCRAGRFKKTS